MSKRKQEIKQFDKEPCKNCPYKSTDDIPTLVFLDKAFTKPATKSTQDFIVHMLKHHPDDLAFLWEECQQYTNIKGAMARLDFPRWIERAVKNNKEYF